MASQGVKHYGPQPVNLTVYRQSWHNWLRPEFRKLFPELARQLDRTFRDNPAVEAIPIMMMADEFAELESRFTEGINAEPNPAGK